MSIFNNNKHNNQKEHSPVKYILHMVLCCGVPLLIITTLPFIAGSSPALAGILGIIAPFICPVMMGGMMFMMFRSKKHSCCEDKNIYDNKSITNNN